MYLVSSPNKKNLLCLFIGFAMGLVAAFSTVPIYKSALIWFWEKDFSDLTFRCDQSMREHLIAKNKISFSPTKKNVSILKSTEIALIDCQDYDLMQKRLTRWGLNENDLGELVLKAAESNVDGLKSVINIHEIRH